MNTYLMSTHDGDYRLQKIEIEVEKPVRQGDWIGIDGVPYQVTSVDKHSDKRYLCTCRKNRARYIVPAAVRRLT